MGAGEQDDTHLFSADVLPALSSTCLFFSNRRELGSIDEVPQISLEEALSSQEVEVAFICSESSSHEDYIRWVFKSSACTVVQDGENAWASVLHRDLNNQWDGSRTLKNYRQNVNSQYGL